MAVVTINFPDRGLLGIHGVPAPCGRVCFRGGEVPHGAKLDAAYTVAVNHDGNSYRMYCHFGVEYLANRRRLAYYFQNEGRPPAELYDLGCESDGVAASIALLGAKCLQFAGVTLDPCEGPGWEKNSERAYRLRLNPQEKLGGLWVYIILSDMGRLSSVKLYEAITGGDNDYRILGSGQFDPFLTAVLGADYWNELTKLVSLGVFKGSEDD